MDLSNKGAALKRELSTRRKRTRFSPQLAARVCAHVGARRAGGATWQSLADKLGIALGTLYRWQRERPCSRTLRPVEVVATKHEVVVQGPCGLRIEGLDLDALAALLRKLA
ncbi:MAG: hypothetical protein JST54_26625 [Deltaproteobacteria bacterium]|nr:hypothetical protein [Deltaproteobacteria bacterium]